MGDYRRLLAGLRLVDFLADAFREDLRFAGAFLLAGAFLAPERLFVAALLLFTAVLAVFCVRVLAFLFLVRAAFFAAALR